MLIQIDAAALADTSDVSELDIITLDIGQQKCLYKSALSTIDNLFSGTRDAGQMP